MNLLAACLLFQVAAADTSGITGARTPAFAPDGRMLVAVEGDIYMQLVKGAPLVRITSGAAWDRDPVFTRDGNAVLFASDRAGNYDIYRVTIGASGAAGEPVRITASPEHEVLPSQLPNGDVVYVRGSGALARLVVRSQSGTERAGPGGTASIGWYAPSPDGARVAYITASEQGRRVVVRSFTGSDSSVANTDRNAERLAWAPQGDRLVLSSRSGLHVVPVDGGYTNFASQRRGDVAWTPDGRQLVVAEYDEVQVGYNGDPDRGLDRLAAVKPGATERLYVLDAPPAPDNGLATHGHMPARDRAERNADAFDRAWQRTLALYYSAPEAARRRASFEATRAQHRAKAIAARDDKELQAAIHDALRARPTLREAASGRAAVSSAHPVSTEAGLSIMRAGGNVVDAAVAVSFALGVVEPDASGIGGYGQMVIALANRERPTLIEFMSRAPEEASLGNTSLMQNGRYPSDGPVLANVPGTVAGMYDAWRKYGSGNLPWAKLLEPAIRAARDGYVVSEGLATTLATERHHFLKYESSRALFFRNGEPLRAGDTLRNPDLAWVLEQIAARGADGFYRGEVAQRYVSDLRSRGNAMKASDLERYFAPEREPVSGTYRGYTIYSSAPPVSGGAELVARLNLLEQFPAPRLYTDDATTLHAALSAWFLVPSSRNRIADPALWPVDIAPIVNRDTAAARWRCFDPAKALRPADVRGDQLPCLRAATPQTQSSGEYADVTANGQHPPEFLAHMDTLLHRAHSQGTTAFTVADNAGNAVSVTQTLGTWGGNFYVSPGLGFLSNDKLTSYGNDPAQYGSRLPFARHGSTIAPTIIMRGRTPVFVLGAAGNAWITAAVYQGVIGAIDFNLGPQQVLELPRFLPSGLAFGNAQNTRYTIQMEDGFAPAVTQRLRELGYDVSLVSMRGELREGYGAAIRIDGKTVTAGADPRRSGAAGAIR